ncbi:13536_t:CDS:2 [Cetraspora pellucida]|uniref:13536_t:CDS:1 n=1 Tax=Cetraspora pellucida TaxID=1433469 RepID=A0ACA9MVY2_9GLOM|nr:13536_t:CDS:2 [Cetraspora pellucida]
MQFEDIKSGWLTKLGGNALRKTWKRRWFNNSEPAGVLNLSTYNSVSQDPSVTKKSSHCIRIEKIVRENDSINSTLSYNKKPTTLIVFADTESEMIEWISVLEKRLGGRNIVDIVLDRLELSHNMHRRQASYSSLSSFYSRNSGFGSSTCSTSASTLSSRRPSLESLSLDTPSLNSRKSSIDSFNGIHQIINGNNLSRPETPSNLVAMFGLGQPILRKPASCSGLQEKKSNNTGNNHPTSQTHVRKLSLTLNKEPTRTQSTPLIMVHGENAKFTSSPSSLDLVYFPNNHVTKSSPLGRKKAVYLDQSTEFTSPSSPITPLANVFPSHLN